MSCFAYLVQEEGGQDVGFGLGRLNRKSSHLPSILLFCVFQSSFIHISHKHSFPFKISFN